MTSGVRVCDKNHKQLEKDAFDLCLKRATEEEFALKDEDFEARFVELGIENFERNVVEPNKTNADMGAKITLSMKIELLDEDNVLGRAGGSRATSKYRGHPLIHYLPKLDQYVFCAFCAQILDHSELPMFGIKTFSREDYCLTAIAQASQVAKDFVDIEGEFKEDLLALGLEVSYAFDLCLKRASEEEFALKDEDFEAGFVELGIEKFERNVVEPNKTNADMGAKITLSMKIELLDEDNVLGRAGGSRATSKYTGHPLIHYLPKLDKYVLKSTARPSIDHAKYVLNALKETKKEGKVTYLGTPKLLTIIAYHAIGMADNLPPAPEQNTWDLAHRVSTRTTRSTQRRAVIEESLEESVQESREEQSEKSQPGLADSQDSSDNAEKRARRKEMMRKGVATHQEEPAQKKSRHAREKEAY
ncbi:hypothetical protein L7F22_025810 [Adiantum nelumboides]|nr:hypothetical protein [Adiantum nelumboides]